MVEGGADDYDGDGERDDCDADDVVLAMTMIG